MCFSEKRSHDRVRRHPFYLPLLLIALWCGGASGCFFGGERTDLTLPSPPMLSSEAVARQGETVNRPRALDRIRFDLPPATVAVLTDEVAQDMGWKEHFILWDKREENYIVVVSEGTTLGVRRRVRITPQESGSEVLIFPPDEGIAVRIKEQVATYLTKPFSGGEKDSPRVIRFSHPFSEVWRAAKLTVIDGGFSLKTVDDDVGFIETERVPLGKASRSWFRGVGEITLIAQPSSMQYQYASVAWRYRIRVEPVAATTTEVTVETVVEAKPDASTLKQLSKGALDLMSLPFGSWITGGEAPRLVLPSRGKLEGEFFAGLAELLRQEEEKQAQMKKKRGSKPSQLSRQCKGKRCKQPRSADAFFSFTSPLFVETRE